MALKRARHAVDIPKDWRLSDIGTSLWGTRWGVPMAAALGVPQSQLWRWATECWWRAPHPDHPNKVIPDWVHARLLELVSEKAEKLRRLALVMQAPGYLDDKPATKKIAGPQK